MDIADPGPSVGSSLPQLATAALPTKVKALLRDHASLVATSFLKLGIISSLAVDIFLALNAALWPTVLMAGVISVQGVAHYVIQRLRPLNALPNSTGDQ